MVKASHIVHHCYMKFQIKLFQTAEIAGVCGMDALQFLHELGHCLKAETGEPHSLRLLFQKISVAMQRGNSAAVLGTINDNHIDYNVFNA